MMPAQYKHGDKVAVLAQVHSSNPTTTTIMVWVEGLNDYIVVSVPTEAVEKRDA
jgi:VCBS repeat-containing protein